MNNNGEEDSPVVTFTAEFEKFGDYFIRVAPGVFVPIDEFIADFEQFIKDYILRKVTELFSQQN